MATRAIEAHVGGEGAGHRTGIRGQVEVEDGDDGDEDAGDDDVEDVVQGLPLDDQVEGYIFVHVLIHVLLAGLVADVPLTALWGGQKPLP